MNGEENSQINNQSKFRFLNPEEKRKLKEIKDEILGDSKNINYDSNVDLAIQFAPTSYDTQRYNIKKLLDQRLTDTLVFNSAEVREKMSHENLYDIEELDEYFDEEFEEIPKSKILVTSIELSDEESYEEEIVNERLEEQTEIIQRELERIMRNNARVSREEKELEKLREEKEILNVKELVDENSSSYNSVSQESSIPRFVEELSENEKNYLDSIQSREEARKRELAEEKRRHAKELFDVEDEVVEENQHKKIGQINNKYVYYGLIILLISLIVFISFKITAEKPSEKADDVAGETAVEVEMPTYEVGEIVPPKAEEVISTYIGSVEILGSNNVNEVAEIVNDSFEYVEGSNETEDFDDTIYANLKNAKPYKDINNLIVLFGNDDNEHFGNLKYLEDSDYFDSIEVNYEHEGITTSYSAISYYTTNELDERLYGAFGDVDYINFITNEIYRSIHEVKSDIIIDMDSEILTLVTYDSEAKLYHVLYLMKSE